MPQVRITAYQEVHYTKVLTLDRDKYNEFMALATKDAQEQWLNEADQGFCDEDIDDHGDIEDFTILPLT